MHLRQNLLLVGMSIWLTNGHCENSSRIIKNNNVQAYSFDLTKLDQLEKLGYERSNGGFVTGVGGSELFTQSYCLINRAHFPANPVVIERCVIVIETLISRNPDGKPTFKNDEALQIVFDGDDLFDSGDTNCISTLYPNLTVFSVGQWAWRRPPLVGGYAHSLKSAWVIDPITKSFKGIPVTSVKCEINEDRD
jgi:hypothetical protein